MKVLTMCSFIRSTYFWTAGWGFTVATEAGPPTVVEGSWFSVAWFSGRNFLRMGFDGGWEYGISCGLKKKVKQVNATHLVNALMFLLACPHSQSCAVLKLHIQGHVDDLWLSKTWRDHQIPGAFPSFFFFFPCLQPITFLLPRRTQESGAPFTSSPFFFKCCVHLTSRGLPLLKTKFSLALRWGFGEYVLNKF